MNFKRLLPFCLALTATASADGATLVWSASADNGFALEGGTEMLPTGNLIRIGVFSIPDTQIQSLLFAGNFAAVDSAFTMLASVTAGQGFGNNPGYFSATSNTPLISSEAGGLNIAGQQLYVWAMSANSVAGVTTSTQHGIFYMPKASNGEWAVPNDAQAPGSATLELSDLTGSNPSDLLSSAQLIAGSFSPNPVESSLRKQSNFALQVVPEPASAGLAIVGGMALLMRRRRRA